MDVLQEKLPETNKELKTYLIKLDAGHRLIVHLYDVKYRHCANIYELLEESEEAEFTAELLSLLAGSKIMQVRIATSLSKLMLTEIRHNKPLHKAYSDLLLEVEAYLQGRISSIDIAYAKVKKEPFDWRERDAIHFFSYLYELSRISHLGHNVLPGLIAGSLTVHIGNEAPRNLLREHFYLDETATTRYHKGEDL